MVCIKLENLFSSFNFMNNLYLHESNYGRDWFPTGSDVTRTKKARFMFTPRGSNEMLYLPQFYMATRCLSPKKTEGRRVGIPHVSINYS